MMSTSLAEVFQYVRISADMCMNNYSCSVVDMVFALALTCAMRDGKRVRIYSEKPVEKNCHTIGHVRLRRSLVLPLGIAL